MDTIKRTEEVLTTAEKAMAALAGESVAEQQYQTAGVLIELAREISGLRERLRTRFEPLGNGEAVIEPEHPPTGVATTNHIPSTKARSKRNVYPRFVREGDNLVKIGWSKREKTEYEHKSPRRVLNALLPAMSKIGQNGKRFTMEKVLPLKDSDGTELPEYQAYVSLAWARAVGLVIQHGRQGYSLAKKGDLSQAAELLWNQTESR